MQKFSRHRPASPFLPLLQSIQACFGLTQARLAGILGVSRATLSQDSRLLPTGNVRGLPALANQRLRAFQQVLPAPHGPALPPPAPDSAQSPAPVLSAFARQSLARRLQQIRLQEYPLQQQLERCELYMAQSRLRQQVLPELQAALLPTADALTQPWLALFAEEARLVLENEAPAAALLELRLRVLAFERAEITKLLGEASP